MFVIALDISFITFLSVNALAIAILKRYLVNTSNISTPVTDDIICCTCWVISKFVCPTQKLNILLDGFKLVGDYLDKTILRPNNLNYPNSRLLFLNTLK